jgi:hypothetical protein
MIEVFTLPDDDALEEFVDSHTEVEDLVTIMSPQMATSFAAQIVAAVESGAEMIAVVTRT